MAIGDRDVIGYGAWLAWSWRIGAILLLIGAGLVSAGMIVCALPPRSNHIGFDIRWLMLQGTFVVLYGVLGVSTPTTRRWGIVLCVAGLLVTVLVLFLDHYNLLVEHARWCDRGMPSRWSR